MSITLDDKDVNVFKLYDEMAIAYSKDIEDYKSMIAAIEVMMAQKQKLLQNLKDITINLLKTTLETMPSRKTPLKRKTEKFNYAGINLEAIISGKEKASREAVDEISQSIPLKESSQAKTPPVKSKGSVPARRKKPAGSVKTKKAEKTKKPSIRPKSMDAANHDVHLNTSINKRPKPKTTRVITELKCLYHPESPILDKTRQLCSSCKWKLINSGLKSYDKEPSVIAYLKGETTTIPDLGQSKCPIHPAVPSYNRKTGLCKSCQKKAKAIGVQDRSLTEDELKVLKKTVS